MVMEKASDDIDFSMSHVDIKQQEWVNYSKDLVKEIEKMNIALQKEYDDDRCSIQLPFDEAMHEQVLELVHKKRLLEPAYIVVIGIGGSNLGTIAVQEAVFGRLYNQRGPDVRILYADTVDSDQIHDIISIVQPVLQDGKNILVCGISKSGGTTETIANFEVFVDLIENYTSNAKECVVAITDRESKFWNLAKEKNYEVLEIPKKVGGRYSVFSPVGLFPLAMIGIDVKTLIMGAKEMVTKCVNTVIDENPAAMSSLIIYQYYRSNKNIHDMFLFQTDFESIGKWYRQLMAESIGKEFDINENRVNTGITPTVSIGSVDLHSMAQLYLGGPFDKCTTFVYVNESKHDLILPNKPEYDGLVKGIQSRRLKDIMDAIYMGTKKAFEQGNRPYVEIMLPDKSEYAIGQLLQMKMMEMMYLGALMKVNPFNQPNVEAYKIETRKQLEQ